MEALLLPRRQRGRQLPLAAEELEAGAALHRPPRPRRDGRAAHARGREWHYWALVTNDGERSADELERWHRAKANLENQIKEAKLGLGLDNLPCKGFHAIQITIKTKFRLWVTPPDHDAMVAMLEDCGANPSVPKLRSRSVGP